LLLAHVRRRSRAIGWREAVHELRDRTQDLWASASPKARGRFLRHLRPYWDVHRHRIAPAVADTIDRMREKGQLETAAGKIVSTEAEGARAIVRWRRRGEAETETRTFDRIVNCTGPELDIGRAGEPLLDSLLAAGRIRPDACRLGVDVDRDCRIIGQGGGSSPNLSAIGPITRGAFWESIAVADIAYQAARAAARIAA